LPDTQTAMLRHRGLWNQIIGRCKAVFAFGGNRGWAIAAAPAAQAVAADKATLYRTLLADQTEFICRCRADATIDDVNPAVCQY